MPIKVTMFLVSDKYSWSEDHYYLPATAIRDAVQPAVQLLYERAPCLGVGAAVKLARLSLVPANGAVQDAIPTQPIAPDWSGQSGLGPAQINASRPYQALQVRFSSYFGYHRNLFLGGAPAGLFHGGIPGDSGLDFSQAGDFSQRLAGFLNFLTSGGTSSPQWGWLSRTSALYSQAVGPLVTNAAYPGMVGVQVAAQLPLVGVGNLVQVKGWRRTSVKSGARLTGVYRLGPILPPVAPATAWTYFLQGTANVVPTNFFTLGMIAPYAPVSVGYLLAQSIQATERKRGATAYRPRGRSRTR